MKVVNDTQLDDTEQAISHQLATQKPLSTQNLDLSETLWPQKQHRHRRSPKSISSVRVKEHEYLIRLWPIRN